MTIQRGRSRFHPSPLIPHPFPVCAFGAAFLFVFGWIVFGGGYVAGGDVFFYTYPLRAAAWGMVRGGALPLWTPHVLSGFPLLAMPQLALGYPLTWGHLFLPPHAAEQVFIFAPFLLAPAFTYFYARERGRSRTASVLAGLAFAYGGLMTNGFGMNGLMTNPVMWLPLLLVAVERARARPFARCLLGGALAYSMSVLTGYGQGFLYVGLVAAAYAAFVSLFARTLSRWRPAAVAAGAIALGAGVGAFQMLETMGAQRRSVRAAPAYEFVVEASFTPAAALKSFAAPLYHFIEVTTSVAPLAFLLALVATAAALYARAKGRDAVTDPGAAVAPERDPRVFFWAALAALSFALMLGDATPLNRWLFRVPLLNLFRRPSRHAFEWTFALSVLAAYGWDIAVARGRARLRGRRAGERARVAAVIVPAALLAACAWLAFAWHGASFELPYVGESVPAAEASYVRWKLSFTACVVAALAASLGVAAKGARGVLLAAVVMLASLVEPYILVRHWWAGTLKDAARLTTPALTTRRLQSLPPAANRVYVRANSGTEEQARAPRFDALDLTALYGLHNVGGYEQLFPARYARALGEVDYDGVTPRAGVGRSLALFGARSAVLDLLNATHVVTFENLGVTPEPTLPGGRGESKGPPLDPARWQTVENFDGVVVLRNLRARPRAWLVAEAEAVDGEEALRRISGESSHDFDPRRTALLEVAQAEMPALPGGEVAPGAAARVAEYGPSRLVVETEAETATLLVVSEMFYPGWEAEVDGRGARIHLTDYLLRGVAVPAGRHRVEMWYAAPAAQSGAIISALSLACLAALAFLARRSRRR